MREIKSFFLKEIDRTLYHYSGIGALLGISQTKCLWASNAYYLNDSKEIIHACDVLEEVTKPRILFGNGPEQEFLKQFMEWISHFRTTTYDIFVFSLSEERNLLSQWRSYTPHGKGISIGMPPSLINKVAKKNNLRIAQCLYRKKDQEELLNSLVEKMLITFRKELPNIDTTKLHPPQCYHHFLEGFRGDILQVLSIVKHKAFEEEREWRLISPYFSKYTVPEIKFREGASMLVPYIELGLPENNDGKVLFEQIILGPSPHQNLSMSALSKLLSNKRLCNNTTNCGIPYREW